MKKYLALLAATALATSAFAMSNAPSEEKIKACGTTCAVKAACCTTDGSCKDKVKDCAEKEACALKEATEKAGCSGGVCPLSK